MREDRVKKEFLESYDLYAEAIYRHCFFRVYSKGRAEELVQETFTRAWEYLLKGKEVQNMRALLYRIATNLIVDQARKKQEESLDHMLENSLIDEPSQDSREETEFKMMFRDVVGALNKLDEEDREILTLRFIDDLRPSEIAEMKNITPNHASVKITRALGALREKFFS